jgi:glycosyltransferase involved in cell wall biosynthesis
MVEKKGLPYLVRAMAKVKSEVSAARLVAAGGGPELERAKALARELELGDAAAFVGPKSHDELKLMYNAADVLAVPSVVARDGETEGMPTVILEAFAAACPVVGSRVAGIPEFVRDGETGFLADAADSGDLAAKIVESLNAGRDRFASSCLAAAAGRDFKKIAQLYAEAAEA